MNNKMVPYDGPRQLAWCSGLVHATSVRREDVERCLGLERHIMCAGILPPSKLLAGSLLMTHSKLGGRRVRFDLSVFEERWLLGGMLAHLHGGGPGALLVHVPRGWDAGGAGG